RPASGTASRASARRRRWWRTAPTSPTARTRSSGWIRTRTTSPTTGRERIASVRVLITGAFGFLGGRLAEGLRAAGAEVVISGRRVPRSAEAWAHGFEVRLGDLLDADVPARLMRGVDAVIHLASLDENEAVQTPELALAVSGDATRRLAAAARAAGASRFVFFSTFHVYGPTAPNVIDEETPTKAAHPYSIAHLAGEGYCRQAYLAGFPAVVLRVSNGYGCPTRVD